VLGHFAPAVTGALLNAGTVLDALGLEYQASVRCSYHLGL
jgi:hypothetical protein